MGCSTTFLSARVGVSTYGSPKNSGCKRRCTCIPKNRCLLSCCLFRRRLLPLTFYTMLFSLSHCVRRARLAKIVRGGSWVAMVVLPTLLPSVVWLLLGVEDVVVDYIFWRRPDVLHWQLPPSLVLSTTQFPEYYSTPKEVNDPEYYSTTKKRLMFPEYYSKIENSKIFESFIPIPNCGRATHQRQNKDAN